MTRNIDYNIADLGPDDLYRLLPYIVRATDPNDSIRVIFNALTEFHNYAAKKLREMPRLQSPNLAGKFSPSDFGESEDDYEAYIDLVYRNEVGGLTDGELGYMDTLKKRLPLSLKARESEMKFLDLLSETVGVKIYGRFLAGILRSWVKTGVYRSHITGTPSSILLLGRVLGFVDLKVAELWSRFAIKDPSEPRAVRNEVDFAYFTEEFPYNPMSGSYGNTLDLGKTYERIDGQGGSYTRNETLQVPYGTITYNPNILDDANFTYTVIFENVTHVVSSRLHYNLIVNGHNPFGNFVNSVNKKLKAGSYPLANGSDSQRARVAIPADDGSTSFVFEALTFGEWANSVVLTIGNITTAVDICDPNVDFDLVEARQRMTLEGPQSKIKFKTSYFDLITAIDPLTFVLHYPAVPVVENRSLREIGQFDYEVDLVANRMNLSVHDDVTDFIHAGDSLLITTSSSQFDNEGFEVDRNKRYTVESISLSSNGVDTNVVVSMGIGENATYDANAYGYAKVEIVSITDSAGDAVLGFSDIVSTSNTDPVTVLGSHSGLYDGDYTVSGFDSLANTLSLDTGGGLKPYVSISSEFGYAFFRSDGYDDGLIPRGVGSIDINGKLLRVNLTGGTSEGAFPVMGTVDGRDEQANSDEQFQLNLKAYFEVIGIIRQIVEEMRPVTRTLRKEVNGLLFRDDVPYAPLLLENSVVLESPSGNRFKLSVKNDLSIVWNATTDATTQAVIQRDIVNDNYYKWMVNDAGSVGISLVSSFDSSVLVYFKAVETDERNAYVTVNNGRIVATANEPESAVDTIHLRDGSEDYLADDIAKVVETIPPKVARFMGPAAVSDDAPGPNFAFQQYPEDDLSKVAINQDYTQGHVHLPWINDVKLEWVDGNLVPVTPIRLNKEGFDEGLWYHYFNTNSSSSWTDAEFRGQDPRWDNRGIEDGMIEPVPSGSGNFNGLDQDYPISFLNFHNVVPWRDRVTGAPWISGYSHSSAASNIGCERIDVDISYLDGPVEPVGSSAISHQIAIEYPWKKLRSRVVTPPDNNYTSLTDNGDTFTRVTFPSGTTLTDLYVGYRVFFDSETNYPDVYQILEVGDGYVVISALFAGDTTVAADSRFIWLKCLELDLWESGDNDGHFSIQPLHTTQASGAVNYRVYVNSTSDLDVDASALVLSGTLNYFEDKTDNFDPTNVTIIPTTQQKRTLIVCIRCGTGTFPVFAKVYQDANIGVLKNADYGGSLAWWGASRDSLQVTLMPTAASNVSALDSLNESNYPGNLTLPFSHISAPSSTELGQIVEVDSPRIRDIWRGGYWPAP